MVLQGIFEQSSICIGLVPVDLWRVSGRSLMRGSPKVLVQSPMCLWGVSIRSLDDFR